MNTYDGQVEVFNPQHAAMSINVSLDDGGGESILDIINAATKRSVSVTAPVTTFRRQSDLYDKSHVVAILPS